MRDKKVPDISLEYTVGAEFDYGRDVRLRVELPYNRYLECTECYFSDRYCNNIAACDGQLRSDGTDVIFVELKENKDGK